MQFAQYDADRYRRDEYACYDPHQVHQYHPNCQKLMPICTRHNSASVISIASSMFITQLITCLSTVVAPAVGTLASLTVTPTALAPFHLSAHVPAGMAIT